MMIASAKAESDYDLGIKYYNMRHSESNGSIASTKNIDIAIQYFENLVNKSESNKDIAIYLLKSYYYKAEFATNDIEQKKEIFNKAKSLGNKYITKYRDSAELRYWYLVNLGSWAKVYGILTAAREGVADQMKTHSEKIIEIDHQYQNGGGYFMLGAVHYKSPYIPWLLSWPDNNEAIKYLQLSHDTGQATLNQKNYLAQALHKAGNTIEATKLLKEVINSTPDPQYLVEELNDIKEAKQLLKDYIN